MSEAEPSSKPTIQSPVLRSVIAVFQQLRQIWVTIGVLILVVLILELISLALFKTKDAVIGNSFVSWCDKVMGADGYNDAQWPQEYCPEHEQTAMQWHPYVYWRRQPLDGELIKIDEHGYRHTDNSALPAACETTQRTFMLGGSTMWGPGARNNATISSHLAHEFAAREQCTTVHNLAERGYVSTQQLLTLTRHLQRDDVPDTVIFYGPINDLFSSYQNGVAGSPQNEINRQQEFNLLRQPEKIRSAFYKDILRPEGLTRLTSFLRSTFSGSGESNAATANTSANTSDELAQATLTVLKQNIRIAETLGREYGFEVAYFWQPYIFSKTTLSTYEQEWHDGADQAFKDFLIRFYALAEADQELFGQPNVFSLSSIFDEREAGFYLDTYHLNEAGNSVVAEQMAGLLVDLEQRVNKGAFAGTTEENR